jgi:hypothetical protein
MASPFCIARRALTAGCILTAFSGWALSAQEQNRELSSDQRKEACRFLHKSRFYEAQAALLEPRHSRAEALREAAESLRGLAAEETLTRPDKIRFYFADRVEQAKIVETALKGVTCEGYTFEAPLLPSKGEPLFIKLGCDRWREVKGLKEDRAASKDDPRAVAVLDKRIADRVSGATEYASTYQERNEINLLEREMGILERRGASADQERKAQVIGQRATLDASARARLEKCGL